MHDIRFIRDNPAENVAALVRRGVSPEAAQAAIGTLVRHDDARKAAVQALQADQERRNALSREIGQAMAQRDVARADALKAEVAALKDRAPVLESQERQASAALQQALAAMPNRPAADVPDGTDEHGNVEHARHGVPPAFDFPAKEHWELGEALGLMDFEAAARLSGARFVVLKGALARLERALGQFFMDQHTRAAAGDLHGYTEVNPPLLVRDDAMFGTAQLPKFRDDQFMATSDGDRAELLRGAVESGLSLRPDLLGRPLDTPQVVIEALQQALAAAPAREDRWLIPTAEVPLTNLVAGQIVPEAQLPLRFTALTPCFRAEAGSAGRDTKGMLRQHQFMKCEMVSITTPEQSVAEHARMLANAEHVLQALGLPYRVMTLCAGDMGFASTKTWDIEVWLPGQNSFREISSCSNCGDFQARRMDARFRSATGNPRFVHTLNGSGVAVGRCLIAVMENYQNADGSITVPDVLLPYMGGLSRIEKGH